MPQSSPTSRPTLSTPQAKQPTSSRPGLAVMAITDRRPTLPVVHCTMRRGAMGGSVDEPSDCRRPYRTGRRPPIRLAGGNVLDLDGLLRFAVEQGASDVHLKVGSRPRLRVDGRLREGPFATVEPTAPERLATAVIPRGRADSIVTDH